MIYAFAESNGGILSSLLFTKTPAFDFNLFTFNLLNRALQTVIKGFWGFGGSCLLKNKTFEYEQ